MIANWITESTDTPARRSRWDWVIRWAVADGLVVSGDFPADEANVARAAKRVKRLGDMLFRSLLDPAHVHLDVETKPITLTTQQLAAALPEIERSATMYLAGIEREWARGAAGIQENPKRVGVNLFSWQED